MSFTIPNLLLQAAKTIRKTHKGQSMLWISTLQSQNWSKACPLFTLYLLNSVWNLICWYWHYREVCSMVSRHLLHILKFHVKLLFFRFIPLGMPGPVCPKIASHYSTSWLHVSNVQCVCLPPLQSRLSGGWCPQREVGWC